MMTFFAFSFFERRNFPKFALSIFLCLLPAMPLQAGPPRAKAPLFESETDPDFVFKLAFRVENQAGSTRLIFNTQKGGSYQLAMTSKEISLFQTSNEKTTLLEKSPASFLAANDLLITRRGSLLRVALGGQVLFETKKAVLAVTSIRIDDANARLKMLEEPRLQPTEDIYLADDFMTTPDAPSHWNGVSGTWHVAGAGRPNDAADPFKFVGFAPREAIALNADSRWFWSDYQSEVSARALDDKGGFGIVVAYRGSQDFLCFSWDGENASTSRAGEMTLWRRAGKKTVVLARRAVGLQAGQWYRVAVTTVGNEVAVYVDENLALKATDSRGSNGQIGLYATGQGGSEFDDVRVQSVTSSALAATRRGDADEAWQERTFATDPFMEAWGSGGADWQESKSEKTVSYWNSSYFFETLEVRIAASLLALGNAARIREISLFGEEGEPKKGYRLALDAGKIILLKNGAVVASGVLQTDAALAISIRGANVQVSNGAKKILSYTDSARVGKGRVGLHFNAPVSVDAIAKAVEVKSPNLVEYRFDAAPVDWKIESGLWQSTTRWACVPNWNFFGGKSAEIATVWNKRGFGGDGWIEAFIAPSEGTSDQMHFSFPINLNMAFGASDERLGSGYNLVYRSHDEATILYRGGKPVAESKELLLPDWRADSMFVYHRLSQTWQHLQILRQGGRIQIWIEVPGEKGNIVERRRIIDYTDPAPLTGDRMALWTWGINGMSVAKLRVSSAQVRLPYADFLKPAIAAPVSQNGWQRAVNIINGGSFRIDLMDTKALPINAMPRLELNYRNTPDTALALYAVANGQRFRADFLGQVRSDGDAIPMGKVQRSGASGQLQHASFSLSQALREFFPSGEPPRIEQLYLANESTLPEQIGGLAANPKGAVFEWRPAPKTSSPISTPATFKVIEPAGDDLPDGDIRIAMQGDDDPAQYTVTVNQRPIKWGEAALEWNGQEHEIRVNIGQTGWSFKDGEKISLTIARANSAAVFSHQWTMRYALDKTPPAAPHIGLDTITNRVQGFETGIGNWKTMGGEQGASLWRDTTTAASGKASLRLYHRKLAGPFGAVAGFEPFDARRFPILTFSYRIPPAIQLSLLCEIGGRWFEIDFTDRDHTFPVIGAIGGVQKDNQWHSAEVDLMAAIKRANVGSTTITKLFFADTGVTNNVQDVFWNVDDFFLVPVVPVGVPHTLLWSARDLSGISGESWVMDNAPATVPPEVIGHDSYASALAGKTYLHVRARDGAGNWSQTAHFRFVADTDASSTSTPSTPATESVSEKTASEKTAPDAPFVSYIPANRLSLLDFEDYQNGLPENFGIRRSAWVLPDTTTAATGMGSARVVNLQAGDFFSAFLQSTPYSIDRYPNVQFDYRFQIPDASMKTRRKWRDGDASAPQRSPYNLNMVAIVNGEMQIIKFIGGPNSYKTFTENTIGEISDARADGQWHSAGINMKAMLRKRYPKAPRFAADYLATWSTGPYGYDNPQGASLWLDNITLFSTVATSAAFEWKPSAGYSYLLDQNPDTLPDEREDQPNAQFDDDPFGDRPRCEFKDLKPGVWYFHLRAVNRAGQWSAASHVRFELTAN